MDVRKGCCTWNLNLGWGAERKRFEGHVHEAFARRTSDCSTSASWPDSSSMMNVGSGVSEIKDTSEPDMPACSPE